MEKYAEVLPHGSFTEVFKDIFHVTGSMKNEFFGSMWQFSRNMTVVREEGRLTLINAVRLDDEGLKQLESLGKVKNVVRIGDLHGLDDAFYVDRYEAEYWALPMMGCVETSSQCPKIDHFLVVGGEMPLEDCSLFVFKTTKRPEGILRLDRDKGILIACDSLQNWVEPDEFITADTKEKMSGMGFFQSANLGPAWMHVNEPQKEDFEALKNLEFKHVLCGHGVPLLDKADEDFAQTFNRYFQI